MGKWTRIVGIVALGVLLATTAAAQPETAVDEQAAYDERQSRMVSLAAAASESPSEPETGAQTHPHKIGLGLYGLYEPSIFPTETWVRIGCFSEYGRSGSAPWLVRVDVLLYDTSWNVIWDTREGGRDFGVCNFRYGVDTTFVEIPRGFEFYWWSVLVTREERQRENVQTGPSWSAPPYVVNSFDAGVTAINLVFDGVPVVRGR